MLDAAAAAGTVSPVEKNIQTQVGLNMFNIRTTMSSGWLTTQSGEEKFC